MLARDRAAQAHAGLQDVGAEELAALLGKGRSKRGMSEGDLDEGELEIGQVSAMIKDDPTCAELVARLEQEYAAAIKSLTEVSMGHPR